MKKTVIIFYYFLFLCALFTTTVSCKNPTATKNSTLSVPPTDNKPSYQQLSYDELKEAINRGEIKETDEAYKYFQIIDKLYSEIPEAKNGIINCNDTVYFSTKEEIFHHKRCEKINNNQVQFASIIDAIEMGKMPCKSCYSTTSKQTKSKKGSITTTRDEIVYITSKGKKYHHTGCSAIKGRNCQAIPKSKAENLGKTPCKKCYKY